MTIYKAGELQLPHDFMRNCNVFVYEDEDGNIPHFHIESDQHFFVCVEIYNSKQYSHNERYNYILDKSCCIQLDKWLREKDKMNKISRWENIKFIWEALNGDFCNFPTNKKVQTQPDYSLMSGF